MGHSRLEFHEVLVEILGIPGQVYFQPPESYKMRYPCIVYKRDTVATEFANNLPYSLDTGYDVTVIDEDPDSDIPFKIGQLPKSSHSRTFTTEDLNHDTYKVYF